MPPRVLFVSKPVVPPFHDGTKCLVRDVSLRLVEHQAVLMAVPGATLPGAPQPGCTTPELVPVYSASGAYTPALRENARAALYVLARARADLFHFVFAPNPRTSAVGRVVRAVRRVPVVQTVASPPRSFAPNLFFGDVLVAQSRWTARRIEAAFDAARRPRPRVVVIPPPVAVLAPCAAERIERVRRELDLPPSSGVVVFPGDLEVGGGAARVASIVLDVVRAAPATVVVFACRHKRPEARALEAGLRARLSGLPVRFAPEIDLPALLGVARAVLFPVDDLYGKVDLPISLLEAMRLGVPVVVPKEGPLADLEGVIRVPLSDDVALASATVKLVEDADHRKDAGERGRRAVERFYDASVVARAYEGVYREVLAGTASRSALPS